MNFMSTISDLYYDNLCLSNRIYNKNSDLYKTQMKLTDMVEEFSKKLSSEDKKIYNEIIDTYNKTSSLLEHDAFTIGLRFGIKLMHEVFQDDVPDCATFPLR